MGSSNATSNLNPKCFTPLKGGRMKKSLLVIVVLFLLVVALSAVQDGSGVLVTDVSASAGDWYVTSVANIYPENVTLGAKTLITAEYSCGGKFYQYVIAGTVPALNKLGCADATSNLKVVVYDLVSSSKTQAQLLDAAELDLNAAYAAKGLKSRVYGTVGITGSVWPTIK